MNREWDLLIHDARCLDRSGRVDIGVRSGRIAALAPALEGHAAQRIDARGGLVARSFVEPHFHLDKCLSRARFGAVSFTEAFARAREVKRNFTVADVEERACRALELAVAHGIGRMRAMVDVDIATRLVSLEGVQRARERFARAIDIEIVAFPQEGIVSDPEAPGLLAEALGMGADLLGGLPEFEASVADQKTHIQTVLDLAEKHGVGVDMHCDYTDDAAFKTLEMLADATIERGLEGRVVANHCNALSLYPDDEAKRVIDKLAAARIPVVVFPAANLQMLGGAKRTPYNRGSSRVKELLDAGINVAAGADNMYDIWYRFNRMDPVEVALITCLSAGMRTDEEVREAFEMVTTRAARVLGRAETGIAEGASADMVVFEAGNLVDVLRNLPGRRIHIKNGRTVGGLDANAWCAGGPAERPAALGSG